MQIFREKKTIFFCPESNYFVLKSAFFVLKSVFFVLKVMLIYCILVVLLPRDI